MATELDKTTSLQTLADSTALIYDRAMTPEKVVGQAWLISKGRVMTTASAVSNYSEAPWALVIKFPHPDVTYGVRTVQVHPDFNKREARDQYLNQAHGSQVPICFDNDVATLALDTDLSPPPPEKIAELNRALSVPFEISPRDMSGSMRPGDLPSILQSAITTGRSGLLTMVDVRNIPFARIGIRQARITRVVFNDLFNEVALCELLYRKPTGNFAFQPADEYPWPADLHELSTTAEQIVAEGVRRSEELPRVIEMLGGLDIRFAKATKYADFSTIKPNERWIAERLWEVLDGFLPLNRVAERIGADTYSTIKMVWEFANMGLISPSQTRAFHSAGQVGPILVPAQDLELNCWDTITAFFLDPISSNPVQVSGNLFGPAKVLNNRTLLHTVTLPPGVTTAALIKDNKLIGIYSGTHSMRGGNVPPIGLNRMTWVGALNELGAKRLRTSEVNAAEGVAEAVETPVEKDPTISQRISLRSRAASMAAPAELPSIPLPPDEETGFLAKFTKQQLAMAAAGSLGLCFIMMLFGMFSQPAPAPAPTATATSTATTTTTATSPTTTATSGATATAEKTELGDEKAAQIAKEAFGLPLPPSGFKFQDSSEKTQPKPSFKLVSEHKNLELMFIQWPNQAPVLNLKLISKNPPFAEMNRASDYTDEFKGATPHVTYVGGHYYMGEKHELGMAATGVIPGKDPNKCIVFTAKPFSGLTMGDLYAVANIIEEFVRINSANTETAADTKSADTPADAGLATPEQLTDYRKKLASLIQANYKQPKVAESSSDNKVGMLFTIDSEGKVSELQMKPNINEDYNKAFKRAYDASLPEIPPAPRTKTGKYALQIMVEGPNVTVEEQ
jgi:hypothetical protein